VALAAIGGVLFVAPPLLGAAAVAIPAAFVVIIGMSVLRHSDRRNDRRRRRAGQPASGEG
jgi:hypothetical protein